MKKMKKWIWSLIFVLGVSLSCEAVLMTRSREVVFGEKKLLGPALFIKASNSKMSRRADYVCDGIDDDVQIQAAIDRLVGAGTGTLTDGGRIELSDGLFIIGSTIRIRGQIWIEGQGIYATKLFAKFGLNDDLMRYDHSGTEYFFTLTDLQVDGYKAHQTTGDCLRIPDGTTDLFDIHIDRVFFSNCKGDSIEANGPWGFELSNSIIEFSGAYGVQLIGSPGPKIIGNKIMDNSGGDIYLDSVTKYIIDSNYFGAGDSTNAGKESIYTKHSMGRGSVITGNFFHPRNNNAVGIHLRRDSDGTTISGNVFNLSDDAIALTGVTGIYLENLLGNTIDNSSITGNSFTNRHATSIPIKIDANTGTTVPTSCVIANNAGADETVTAASPTLTRFQTSLISTASNDVTATLPDGLFIGQIKTIVLTDSTFSKDGGTTVSVTHHEFGDPYVYTLKSVDEKLVLAWTGTEWATLSGNDDLLLSSDSTGGNALARNQFIGLPRIKMVALPLGTNGTVETVSYIDATPTGEWIEVDAGTNIAITADTTYYRDLTNSLKIAFGTTAVENDGVDGTIIQDDLSANESIGFWIYSSAALASGDLDLTLDDTDGIDQVYPIPAIPANIWKWVEINIAACDTNCNTTNGIQVSLTAQGALVYGVATGVGVNVYLDAMYKWDASDENALGSAIVQDGVISLMSIATAASSVNTPSVLTEYTDYFVHYETGNDFIVTISDQSANSGVALVAY